jgi:c(7)-type cytochrome triheme protein
MSGARPSRTPVLLAATAVLFGSAIAAGRPVDLRLPQVVTYGSSADSPGPVRFSHETHVAFASRKCLGCHPAPFKMLRPTRAVTHAEMEAGRLCGACHDGKTASGVLEDCEHCHQPPPAGPGGGGS